MSLDAESSKTDKLVPKDQSTPPEPIIWDKNAATIDGFLHEIDKYYVKSALFQSLIKHGSVLLPNGKVAVDSIASVYFLSGQVDDKRSFEHPCPVSA